LEAPDVSDQPGLRGATTARGGRFSHSARQYVTGDFPVLSAGPTPHTPLEEWSFAIGGAIERPVSWQWEDLTPPSDTIRVDIHCVTKWSKLATRWKGVSVDTLWRESAAKGGT
jgi:DMSO/TMAO reductase YedYZ molybdopterin-dependent catalytic subunit